MARRKRAQLQPAGAANSSAKAESQSLARRSSAILRPALTLVATPIGNLGDLSDRAKGALIEAEWWLVEDTRVSGKLQAHLGIKRPMRVLNEHTPPARMEFYVSELAGSPAALITDAGSPAISDPGSLLVDLCAKNGLEIDAVPGPSAVVTALMLSGFFAQQFAFLGYLPRKDGAIRQQLKMFADSTMTLVLFESPLRFERLLRTASEVLAERRYVICRELTKSFQQVYRGMLPLIPTESEVPRRGEVTLVIEGFRRHEPAANRVTAEHMRCRK